MGHSDNWADELRPLTEQVCDRLFEGGDFVFVGNLLDVEFPLPANLGSGICLRPASDDEIIFVRDYLSGLIGGDGADMPHDLYEQQWIEKSGVNCLDSWPRDAWRYYVIASEKNECEALARFREVAPLGRLNLRLGPHFAFLPIDATFAEDGDYFGDGGWRDHALVKASIEDFEELPRLAAALPQAIEVFPPLQHALTMFHRVPFRSDLSVLGLFVALECVLTHNPQGRTDGLNHQVQTKMALLSNRFDVPLDYSQFEEGRPETVWRKLYEYRSVVAHGGIPDFESRLQILSGAWRADAFLREAVRHVLAQAVQEPELMRDLQAC